MLTKDRIEVSTSLDGDGWSVRIGEAHWRFSRWEFANQFCNSMLDEHFSNEIMEHAHNHVWELCQPEVCRGSLWQIIQGMN